MNRPNNGIQLPDKPKFRSLVDKAKANYVMPYVIEKNSDGDDLDYNEDFVVGLGPLKLQSLQNYARLYNENLQVDVGKCVYALVSSIVVNNPETTEEQRESIGMNYDEDGNAITPLGVIKGDVQLFICEVALYILAQYGRILEDHADGTFDYEPISADTLRHIVDANVLFDVDDDGTVFLFEIFEISGMWSPKRAAEKLDDDKLKEEEKN